MGYGNAQSLVTTKLTIMRPLLKKMVAEQENMRIPSALIPCCPVCGAPMTMNLRADDTFVEDIGWHIAAGRYQNFLRCHKKIKRLVSGIRSWQQHTRNY